MNAIEHISPVEQVTDQSYSQDIADHEKTYEAFVKLLAIAALHVATCVVALAIGGAENHWGMTAFFVFAASLAAAIGAGTGLAWRPGAAVLGLAVVCMALLG